MRLTRWLYDCASCGHQYELAAADLSFSYGTLLAHARSGSVLIVDVVRDGVFAEVRDFVSADSQVMKRSVRDRTVLVHRVFEITLDPDDAGDRYSVQRTPGCPACGSTKVAWFQETDDPSDRVPVAATHSSWDSLTAAEKANALAARLHAALADQPEGP